MKKRTKAEAALLATTLIWGGTFPVVKIGLLYITPVLMILVRFLLGSIIFVMFFRRAVFPIPRSSVVKGSVLTLFLFLGFVAQNIGLTYTTASKSAFITSVMVVFVPLLQFVVERRPPKIGNVIGVAIVTAGLWLLTSPAGSAFNVGDSLTLVCSILFAVYIVYLDVVSKQMSALQLTTLQMLAMTAFSLVSIWFVETPAVTFNVPMVLSMLYLSFCATALTTFVQTRYQKDTTPTRAAIIFTIEPVVASAAAYWFLGERLGLPGVLGGALILTGVAVSEFSGAVRFLDRPVAAR